MSSPPIMSALRICYIIMPHPICSVWPLWPIYYWSNVYLLSELSNYIFGVLISCMYCNHVSELLQTLKKCDTALSIEVLTHMPILSIQV
jgi:hypothetical protein